MAARAGADAAKAEQTYLALVRDYQSAILNYIWRRVGDPDLAEDLTQETFVKAWRALDRLELDDEAEPRRRAWLYTIAHNAIADHARRQRRIRWLSLDALPHVSGGGNPAPDVAQRDPLEQALSRLTADQREVLLLFSHEGLPAEDVAQILGITAAAARKRRQRAREAFAVAWTAIGETLPEMTLPDATMLEATLPEATLPEATLPEATLPEATLPEGALDAADGGANLVEGRRGDVGPRADADVPRRSPLDARP